MTYDLHGSWETITGINAPLYSRSGETGEQATLNTVSCYGNSTYGNRFYRGFVLTVTRWLRCGLSQAWAANYWVAGGCPSSKMAVGVATYGRTFLLKDGNTNGVGAPASDAGPAGKFTGQSGFYSYYEVGKPHFRYSTLVMYFNILFQFQQ